MLFASTSLAARIERAEAGLVSEAAEAVRRRRPAEKVLVRPIAGGVAVWAGEGSPMNKVAGLGFAGPVDAEVLQGELEALEGELDARGSPVLVELSSLADPSVPALLAGRGYAFVGSENVLGCDLRAPRSARAVEGVEIELGDPSAFDAWLDVVVTGFAHPDTQGVASHESYPREMLERVLTETVSAGGFTLYLARRGGEPAGGASMRTSEGIVQLCGSATVPAHRRRGVQTALLARRLADAAARGGEVCVVTTQPGSKSQENVQKQGFELLYTRAVLVRGA